MEGHKKFKLCLDSPPRLAYVVVPFLGEEIKSQGEQPPKLRHKVHRYDTIVCI